ncbi:origin recognition complex subunit [Ophiostoma piceae UAMH 11346]|uniref:Origin recognition complex subunit n=1 Tax=Ophiostoma piceae (strain UAMH 11346) TaxID=1262450 RepID=S3BWD1_OPHP1|nr:origin recognition complex subunit [Ophiostoma piceae UAMH 11346]
MAPDETETTIVHQVAYIFDPSDDEDDAATEAATSPSRRRKHQGAGGDGDSKRRKKTTPKKSTAVTSTTSQEDTHNSLLADDNALAAFPPLLQGRESPEAVARRSQLYSALWSQLDTRIQSVLQRSNDVTLSALLDFVNSSYSSSTLSITTTTKLPAAFVVLGPAATTDMLLFRQLATSLTDSERELNDRLQERACIRRMVRLRANETPNLRAALKTIVQEATTVTSSLDDDVVANDGRKYLAYDLEAVASAIPSFSPSDSSPSSSSRIVVAFEDCEAFDGALLADLISFLHSWLDRIPFVLLFGVATSIDLFQGRLPKQAAHRLAAAQFDVAPSSAVLDKLLRRAVAAADVPLRLGPALVRSLAERQDEQVTGVSVYVNSLKYAYMCYFYANPLSVFLQDSHDDSDNEHAAQEFLDNPDYLAAIRQLPSFRRHVEALVAAGDVDTARGLLGADDNAAGQSVLGQAVADQLLYQRQWTRRLARALHIASASTVFADQSFTELYIAIMEDSTGKRRQNRQKQQRNEFTFDEDPSLAATMTSAIRRMSSAELIALARRLADAALSGDEELSLPPIDSEIESYTDLYEARWAALGSILLDVANKVEELQQKLEDLYSDARYAKRRAAAVGANGGVPQLRSKYTAAQSKAVRTTVVAQKVQLSRDSAALTDEDQAFTEHVDTVVAAVASVFDVNVDVDAADASQLWLQEIWLYDARTPYRDVFIPRPGLVVERALARPHDYLACDCCGQGEGGGNGSEIRPTLPPTAILYQLYQDAGPLINVADLWEAFLGVVGDKKEDQGEEVNMDDDDEAAADDKERRHLVKFYQGLSEMKTLGYIKPTRRKVDHVAKIKWL